MKMFLISVGDKATGTAVLLYSDPFIHEWNTQFQLAISENKIFSPIQVHGSFEWYLKPQNTGKSASIKTKKKTFLGQIAEIFWA